MFKDHKAVAYALMRLALGVDFLGHGFFRILSGVGDFVNHSMQSMDKGPLPHILSLGFLYATPFLELALGIALILGLFTRFSLTMGALFMVALIFGTTSIQNWPGAALQLQYSLIFFALLWLAEANTLSMDGLIARKNV